MHFIHVTEKEFAALRGLQLRYKAEIGEETPTEADFARLLEAINAGDILFYACADGGELVGCCSVSPTFSTFDYRRGGVFEDFYVLPEYRGKGIARKLVRYAFRESGVSSLTVGRADCDVGMYNALGFSIPLGNMLAFDDNGEE